MNVFIWINDVGSSILEEYEIRRRTKKKKLKEGLVLEEEQFLKVEQQLEVLGQQISLEQVVHQ